MTTDSLNDRHLSGPSKIDFLQNIITLRSNLHDAWDDYEFSIDPDNSYRVSFFVNGNADIDGLPLHLDHIQGLNIRPLDALLKDHFIQGLLQHVRGPGESNLDDEDFPFALSEGHFDLSSDMWSSSEGKEYLEFALQDRLLDHQVVQETGH